MRPWLALVLLIHGPLVAQRPGRARDVVDEARAAAARGTLQAFRDRWERAPASVDRRLAALALGSAARLAYRFPEAARLFRAAEGDTTVPDEVTARAALGLASVEAQQFNVREASRLLLRARALAVRSGSTDVIAEGLLQLVSIRQRTDGVASALATADSAARLFGPADASWKLELACRRAQVRVRTGDTVALRDALTHAASAAALGDARVEGQCWLAAAQAHFGHDKYRDAAIAFGAAADRFEAGRDQASLSAALQWRGYTNRLLGEFDAAKADFSRAIEAGTVSGNRSPVAWAWLGLSALSLAAAEPVRAADEAHRGRLALAAIDDRWGLAEASDLAGAAAHQLGDLKRARARFLEAIAQSESLGAVTNLVNHGAPLIDIERELSGETAALARLAWMDSIARRARNPTWDNERHYHLGLLALRRGDGAGALGHFRRFRATLDERTLNAVRRFDFAVRHAEAQSLAGDVLQGARMLDSAIARFGAWRASISDRALRIASWDERSIDSDPDLGIATIIARTAHAGHDTLALRLANARRSRDLRSAVVAGADRAPAAGELWLQFVTGRRGEPTTLFIRRGTSLRSAALPPVDSLLRSIAALRSLLAGNAAATDLARVLGTSLLGSAIPAADSSTRHLVIVPDGMLHGVPWAALVLPDGRRVIERFAVTTRPVAPAPPRERTGARGSPIVALGLSAGAARWEGATLAPLPRAEREAHGVATAATNGRAIVGAAATERAVRSLAASPPSILHFAMHAIVDDRAASRAAIVLAPADGDDGLLTAHELASMRLPAELVVLSGCSTASGRVLAAEGVQGLVRPLFDAGVQGVVATQWPTSDASAAQMMAWFYAELARGLSTADALRAAQLRGHRAGLPPGEWAGWSYVGDPSTRVSATLMAPRSTSDLPPLIAGFSGLLAVGALVAWFYRTPSRRVRLRT
ncbi:MAG: CHAT domain-containing protein [Gemmatimonadaceae bacterium]|nr:CHAT domain-containing protein [Gemmatimonadaceae bacterium]